MPQRKIQGARQIRERLRNGSSRTHDCSACGRGFRKREHLTRHELTHTSERPFKCRICGSNYARRDTLQRHLRAHDRQEQVNGSTLPSPVASSSLNQSTADLTHPHTAQTTSQASYNTSPLATVNPIDQVQSTVLGQLTPGLSSTVLESTEDEFLWDVPDVSAFEIPTNFDFDSLDLSLDFSSIDFGPMTLTESRSRYESGQQQPLSHVDSTHARDEGRVEFVRDREIAGVWFTHFTKAQSPSVLVSNEAMANPTERVDDQYRRNVENQLNRQPPKVALPSTSFLNRCIRLYMVKFSYLFPILHLPSFRPVEKNAMLLVSICTIGSQLMGTTQSMARGRRMFDNLHHTILASWTSILKDDIDTTSILLAVVLGQMFAILSSEISHLLTARAFHGTLLLCYQAYLKRRFKSFRSEDTTEQAAAHGSSKRLLDEIQARIGCALRIQDTELALLFHQAPLWQMKARATAILQSDQDFSSPEWIMPGKATWNTTGAGTSSGNMSAPGSGTGNDKGCSVFSKHTALSDILSGIAEKRASSWPDESFGHLEVPLRQWFSESTMMFASPQASLFRLNCLWHSGWIAIACDLDELEICLGRDGPQEAAKIAHKIQQWASTTSSHRALMHAYCIWRSLTETAITELPAIHVPRCAFQAGLVFCALFTHAPKSSPIGIDFTALVQYDEIQMMAESQYMTKRDWAAFIHKTSTLRDLEDMAVGIAALLQKLGPWGISQNLAVNLEAIIDSKGADG